MSQTVLQAKKQERRRDPHDLSGLVVLVTGGGQGLGQAICETLAASGAIPVVADVRAERAQQVAQKTEEDGGTAEALSLDVSDESQIPKAVEAIVRKYGRLDALINNAGINITLPIEELSVKDFDRILAVNLRASFLTAKAVFPVMKEQGKGFIINVVSTAAKRAWANAAAYHASKWGLLGLTQAIHVEGRKHNIKVTALIAGGMRTPFLLEPFPDIDVTTLQDPANVAASVAFLLTQPEGTVIPELMVLPLRETSWP